MTKYLGFLGRELREGGLLLCLVGSIEPIKLLFNRTRVDHMIRSLAFNPVLARGAQCLGSGEHPHDASLKHVAHPLCKALRPRLTQVPGHHFKTLMQSMVNIVCMLMI